MLDVVRVARDRVAKHVHVDGASGGVFEKMSVPITEISEIFGPTES